MAVKGAVRSLVPVEVIGHSRTMAEKGTVRSQLVGQLLTQGWERTF